MRGLWLIQLGTPESPTPREAKKFIREFLMDPRVIDIPLPLRWCLVNIIVPLRAKKISHAYESIWTKNGSPLRAYSLELEQKLAKKFEGFAHVKLGMTYGNPSLQASWEFFKKAQVSELVVLPLFPQYSSATTGACLETVFRIVGKEANIPALKIVPPFYKEDFFLDSFVDAAKSTHLQSMDHILFSFHGLPERQIKKSDSTGEYCLMQSDCCERPTSENAFCYRSQSIRTARTLAERLQIPREKLTICFQSRLGRTPWLRPYTDEVITELAKKGAKRLAVFSPSFVADCLETLEEIGIRAREQFLSAGGQELRLIPSLNASDIWAEKLASHIQGHFRPL